MTTRFLRVSLGRLRRAEQGRELGRRANLKRDVQAVLKAPPLLFPGPFPAPQEGQLGLDTGTSPPRGSTGYVQVHSELPFR